MSQATSTSLSVPKSMFNIEGIEEREIGVTEVTFVSILFFSVLDFLIKFSEVSAFLDEIIILPTNEHTLEIAQQLYEFIHLSLPSRRAHADKSDCNQEILEQLEALAYQEPESADPRWSVLQNLKK